MVGWREREGGDGQTARKREEMRRVRRESVVDIVMVFCPVLLLAFVSLSFLLVVFCVGDGNECEIWKL